MGKVDVKTKDFWRDNAHFADLFNAVIFHGTEILHPEDLSELDTDDSVVVETDKKYVGTLTRARDIVRKYAFDMEFVILCLENQAKIDYAEPVRTMTYDAAAYWRECRTLSRNRNGDEKAETWDEVFSMGKDDRIHPIVTVVVYYASDPWDGPKSLHEMFVPVPPELLKLVPDYPIHLVEIRDSDHLIFHNPDVAKVFSLVRKIYRRNVEDEEFLDVRRDLAEVVGAIIGSEKIVNLAKRKNRRKESMKLCKPLQEMMQESEEKGREQGREEGRQEGRQEGRREGEMWGKISAYHDAGWSARKIADRLNLPEKKVESMLPGKSHP